MEQQVKACLRISDEDESFACLKKVIQAGRGSSCPPRLVLLLEESDCDPCEKVLVEYAEDIKNQNIQVVSTSSQDGKDIIRRNKIEYAPVLLLLDCQNQIIE